MAEAFPTIGGDGVNSYTKNSQSQKEGADTVKGMIEEAIIENLDTQKLLSISTTVTIVDLGCSIGPNTFFAVQNLIESVQNKHSSSSSSSSKTLEFQVFFNDHSINDFNTLFTSLPPERPYHAAGVPGSFHSRLFPSNSINIAYSFNALPWLSKQPELGFLNEGRIHYAGASERVLRAYSDQFERDFESFMSVRAEEIMSGGLMFLVLPFGVELPPACVMFRFLGLSLMELASEGVVDKRALDAYNLPVYFPAAEEMKKVVEKKGCFSIVRTEFTNPFSKVKRPIDADSTVRNLRATNEGILTAHFGKSAVEKIFGKMFEKAPEISISLEASYGHSTQMLLVLKRNEF